MKRVLSALAALALLFACSPENNTSAADEPGNGKDNTVHVTGISIDRTSATIKEGETISLVATVTPANAENKAVTWSSSSDAVATVDNTGKVTGVKAGSATITATTEDGGKKATCSLSVEANNAPSVTVEADHISAISVVLHGKANLGTSAASDLKIGFQYSESAGILPSNSTTVEAEDADANYNYTTAITGLEPETKYYFRSFVRQNGQDTYGETKEFTTKDVASLLETNEASDIEATSANLNAKLDLTDVKYTNKSYGFYFGTSETAQNTKINGGEIEDNAYSASRTGLSHKTQYWYKAFVTLDSQTFYGEVKTFTTEQFVFGAVDLGLPSGLKWANANLGASAPEDYGDYYAWGETEPKENYIWSTYKWGNGSYDTLTKYNTNGSYGTFDNKTVLDLEDDVAHVKLGGSWRMPTKAEWAELLENCTWTWTTQNGVNGRLVTASNGNSIFLPAAGYRDGTNFSDVGSRGYYWSSSLLTDYPYFAWYVDFFSGNVGRRYDGSRYDGFSLRPVSE